MGEIRSQDKRDKLRLIYADLKGSERRLKDALLDGLRAASNAIDGTTPGTFLSSTSEGSGHVAFSSLEGFTPADAKRMYGELNDLYDVAVLNVGSEDTDGPIYDCMMALLLAHQKASRQGIQKDWTGLRYGGATYLQ